MAQAGLTALESWTVALSPAALKPFFREVLPCLDGYLRTSAEADGKSQCRVNC